MTMRTFLLGAPDPEMGAIESLLRQAGQRVLYASVLDKDGQSCLRRVRPDEAHRPDLRMANAAMEVYGTDLPDSHIITVECAAPAGVTVAASCDHHRPGDPGYGRPAAEFLSASSIGQVVRLLASDVVHDCIECGPCACPPADVELRTGGAVCGACGVWLLRCQDLGLIAAADHCLAAAYRGECPGVDPDALMTWRAQSRAAFQRRAVADVLADVARARKLLSGAKNLQAVRLSDGVPTGRGMDADYGSVSAPANVANLLHHEEHIPELPEAAAREGRAFICRLDGGKVVLQCATDKQVQWFLDHFPASRKYGDPARGFAGGYL